MLDSEPPSETLLLSWRAMCVRVGCGGSDGESYLVVFNFKNVMHAVLRAATRVTACDHPKTAREGVLLNYW